MQHATIDISHELAEAPITWHHWRLCGIIGLIVFFDGYDVFTPAYIIHAVAGPWALRPAQAGLLVSSGLVGFLIGSAGHGRIADRIGRRVTLLGALWISGIFTLATAVFATSFTSFCLLRVLTGLGLGVLFPLGTTYINEFAPRRAADVFPLWGAAFGWSLGGAAAGLTGVLATPVWGWQSLYYIGSLSLPLALLAHFVLPESLRFLAVQGHTRQAAELLSQLRPDRAAAYIGARFAVPAPAERRSSFRDLLAPRYRRITLGIWAAAFFSLFAAFGLTGWIPTVMIGRGETFAASFGFGALMQIMSFVGGLLCATIADRMTTSRGILMMWWAIGALCVWALATINLHLSNLLLVGAAGFFCLGAQHMLNNFTARAYQTSLRATGVGMELGVGRIGGILGPFIVGGLQQLYPGTTASFLVIGAAVLAAAISLGLGDAVRREAAAQAVV